MPLILQDRIDHMIRYSIVVMSPMSFHFEVVLGLVTGSLGKQHIFLYQMQSQKKKENFVRRL